MDFNYVHEYLYISMCIWNIYLCICLHRILQGQLADKAIERQLGFYPFPYLVSVINKLVETDIVPPS